MMSHFDYAGLRETLVDFLGEKEAIQLCGQKGNILEIFDTSDEYLDAAYNDAGEFLLADDGELFKELRVSDLKIRPGNNYRRLAKLGYDCIILAAMLKNGINPDRIIGRAHWETETLAEKFMDAMSYFSVKTILPGKNIKDLYIDATMAVTRKSVNGKNRHHEISNVATYLYMNNLPFEHKMQGIDVLLDINANSIEINRAVTQYLKNKDIANNGFSTTSTWVITNLVFNLAPQLWALKGYSFTQIFDAVEIRAREHFSSNQCVTSEPQFQAALNAFKGYVLAGFPEEWSLFSVKSHHFLGYNLIDSYDVSKNSNKNTNHFYHFSSLAKCAIKRSSDQKYFNKKALQNLFPHFPDIYDIKNAAYDGSRSTSWHSKILSIKPGMTLLKEIHRLEIWHPLCNIVEFAKLSDSDSAQRIFEDFLDNGTKWREGLAKEIFDGSCLDINHVITKLKNKKQFRNLAKLLSPTSSQFSLIPDKYKSSFLKVQLGI
jgi:hypothetical protein